MKNKPWICPFCNKEQIITDYSFDKKSANLTTFNSKYSNTSLEIEVVICANPACKEIELKAELFSVTHLMSGSTTLGIMHRTWQLMPESSSKPQPNFIPAPITQDYYEACSIRDLSPKASATLSRRCIQGMIRDFCDISEGTLDKEIKALSKNVEEGHAPRGVSVESVEALDHIRKIGNIGAHMEKDINVIIDVDAGKAQKLIDVVELLFQEWYVARHNREQRLNALKDVAATKDAAKKTKLPEATEENGAG